MLLSLFIACGTEPTEPPLPDEPTCSVALLSVEFPEGEAGNRVVWSLSGSATTVTAEASWYDGGVVAQTTYDLPEEEGTVEGVVSFLPYATGLDLQEIHGADIALTLTALNDSGQPGCTWSGSVPFFTPDWSGKTREMASFTVSDFDRMDASLTDTYLLAPQSISASDGGIRVMLYSAVGDVIGSYGLSSSADTVTMTMPSGTDLRQGQVHLLTDGVPGLTTSMHCRFAADSGVLEDCVETGALMHHGLFVNDSGTTAFSSQWQEDDEGVTAISLPTQRDLTGEGEPEVILDLAALLDATANYENSFTRSPVGLDGSSSACSTDHISLPGKDSTLNLEMAFCFDFTGEELLPDKLNIIVSDAFAQLVFERLNEDIPIRLLPEPPSGISSTDFLHDLKRVRLADRHRVFVYNLGHFDPVRVNVFDFPDDSESTLRCTAELPDDEGTLYYGSVVLPHADSAVFGAYAATGAMDLRWFEVDTCTEVATMLSAKDTGSGQWMTPVAAADLHMPTEEGTAEVSAHQVSYHTANWSAD